MTAKHTPGPWRALDRMVTLDTDDLSCVGAIATTHVRRTARPIIVADVARANAKLIASAPALADALEAMRNAFEYCECCQRRMIQPSHDPEECGSWHQAYLQADAALRAAGRLP